MLPTLKIALQATLPCLLLVSVLAHGQSGTPTPPEYKTIGEHEAPVKHFGFVNKGKLLASVATNGTVKVWDVELNELQTSYVSTPTSRITNFQVTRDGEIAVVADGMFVYFVDAESGEHLSRRIFPEGRPRSSGAMVWGPKGENLFSVTPRGDVARTPRANKGGYQALKERLNDVTSLALDKSGKKLAAACADGSIVLVKTQKMTPGRTLKGSQPSVECVAYHPKGSSLATGSRDKSILLWKPTKAKSTMSLIGHESAVTVLVYHAAGKVLASSDSLGIVKLWDLKTGACLVTLDHPGEERANAMMFGPEGKTLAVAGLSKGVTLWDVSGWL